MKDNAYKVIDNVTGEIIESNLKYLVIEDAHNRMEDYKKMYDREFYLEYQGNNTWILKEYIVGEYNG